MKQKSYRLSFDLFGELSKGLSKGEIICKYFRIFFAYFSFILQRQWR